LMNFAFSNTLNMWLMNRINLVLTIALLFQQLFG